MIRVLGTLAWARWRTLKNSLRGARRRDRLEKASRIGALLVPILYALMLIPTYVALGVGAFAGGWYMARTGDASEVTINIGRVLLAVITLGVLFAPLVRSMQRLQLDVGRLLLLPIPRRLLHVAEAIGAVADPWVALSIPALLLLPAGLALGGAPVNGLLALLAGVLFIATMGSLGSLCANAVMLVFRDRRRAEWLTLVVFAGAALLAFVPNLVDDPFETRIDDGSTTHGADAAPAVPDFESMFRWAAPLPSELWGGTIIAAVRGRTSRAAGKIVALAVTCGILFALSGYFHRKLLENPERSSGKRSGAVEPVRTWTIPWAGQAASAVAAAQVRTVLRTVRGKMAVYFVVVAVVLMAMLLFPAVARTTPEKDGPDLGPLVLLLGATMTLLSLSPVLMNQFAVDGPGLTLQFLTPVTDRDLVRGKALGCIVLAGISLVLCLAGSLIVSPGGHPLAWLAMLLVCVSALVPLAPACTAVSAYFPKVSDLSRIGKAGNPHPIAGFVGVLLTALALGPPAALYAVGMLLLEKPAQTVLMTGLWSAVALGLAALSSRLATRAVSSRRENLFLVASEQ